MASITAQAEPVSRNVSDRRAHRITCVLAGGLAVAGAVLALAIHPAFAALAVVGGAWLVLAPATTRSCPPNPGGQS